MSVVEGLKKYIFEVLGVPVHISPWQGAANLPVFLTHLYEFLEASIENRQYVFIVVREDSGPIPSVLEKHLKKIETKTEYSCVYVFKDISAYVRKRLIVQRISFIVPWNQMYLPGLGLDLRERFRRLQHNKKSKILSPAAQAVVIYVLLHPEIQQFTPLILAENLKYTAMTMTRVLHELESINICKITQNGKQKYIRFDENRRNVWEKTKPFMRSPVKKRMWISLSGEKKLSDIGNIAGLDALARQSMLNGPSYPILAIWGAQWNRSSSLEIAPSSDEADLEIELWIYNPNLFAKNGLVDPFSLFLSLDEEKDERTEMALDKLMGEINW